MIKDGGEGGMIKDRVRGVGMIKDEGEGVRYVKDGVRRGWA